MRIVRGVASPSEVSGHDPLGHDDVRELEVLHPGSLETGFYLVNFSVLHVGNLTITHAIPERRIIKN